jgi:hypothetical protein
MTNSFSCACNARNRARRLASEVLTACNLDNSGRHGDEFRPADRSVLEAAKGVPLSLRPRSDPSDIDVVVGPFLRPNLAAIDALARLQLAAARRGRRIRLRHASSELRELLAFTGFSDVLPCELELRLEPERQTEEREQALGVEEEGELGDSAV